MLFTFFIYTRIHCRKALKFYFYFYQSAISENISSYPIKCLTISFNTCLRCAIALICASPCDMTKRDKIFMMAQKMQTCDENYYHKRSPLSTTGVGVSLIFLFIGSNFMAGFTCRTNRNPNNIMGCGLLTREVCWDFIFSA